FVLTLGGVILFAVKKIAPFAARAKLEWRDWFDALAANPAVLKLRDLTGISDEGISEAVRTHALDAVKYANATAHVLLYLLIGLIIAIMFLFEREGLI